MESEKYLNVFLEYIVEVQDFIKARNFRAYGENHIIYKERVGVRKFRIGWCRSRQCMAAHIRMFCAGVYMSTRVHVSIKPADRVG